MLNVDSSDGMNGIKRIDQDNAIAVSVPTAEHVQQLRAERDDLPAFGTESPDLQVVTSNTITPPTKGTPR